MTMTPGGAATETTLASLRWQRTPMAAVIASGQSLSGALDFGALVLSRIDMPAEWTAAALTFQVSADGVTYVNLYDESGNEVTVASAAVVASRGIALSWINYGSIRYLKVRSGTSALPVAQGADRTLTLVLG